MPTARGDAPSDLEVRRHLAELLDTSVGLVCKIRKTDESSARISVVDVSSAVTGLDAVESARALRRIFEAHPEVRAKCPHLKFKGRGQRDTPVADIATIVEIIFLLPGRSAARVRCEAAKILVRYLGGDLSIVDEVQNLAHIQTILKWSAPEHPLRCFGEAVERKQGHMPGAYAQAGGVSDSET